jgi:hypothetical protein
MIEVPTAGPSREECFVCTGPKGLNEGRMAKDACIVGMIIGIKRLAGLSAERERLCPDHEAHFRKLLVLMGLSDPELLTKLDVPFKIAGGEE